jgi:hypothetical protein
VLEAAFDEINYDILKATATEAGLPIKLNLKSLRTF